MRIKEIATTRNNDGSNDVEQDHTKNTAGEARPYCLTFVSVDRVNNDCTHVQKVKAII